ncbi:MAG: lipopolysaccharide kinase InaA family protein [Desulfobacterales bacterium]|nr:lipopolysaccharide kinase InaA family protein [Desulfobacterales bacterium]
MTVFQKHRAYRFGSAEGLTEAQMERLISCFSMDRQPAQGTLGGRTRILSEELPGIGRVVIKPYHRGGILRHFNRRTYINTGMPRSQAEFMRLDYVRQIGVNAPEPVAFATRGRLFYHAWLVTKELPAARSLADAALNPANLPGDAVSRTAAHINRLIRHRILHVDLHPGNVLLDAENRVYIIDFDKARITRQSTEQLALRYCRRWQRAVAKYGLPEELNESFQRGVGCRV